MPTYTFSRPLASIRDMFLATWWENSIFCHLSALDSSTQHLSGRITRFTSHLFTPLIFHIGQVEYNPHFIWGVDEHTEACRKQSWTFKNKLKLYWKLSQFVSLPYETLDNFLSSKSNKLFRRWIFVLIKYVSIMNKSNKDSLPNKDV